jgi:signal transduction histidine kinase/ActR/RegA family two-component response regulator
MARHEDKTREELLKELQELQQENITLKALYDKDMLLRKKAEELVIVNEKLAFQFKEKEKRAEELVIANKELAFQSDEKEKRAEELVIANKELAFQFKEKEKRAEELVIANKELAFQFKEKEKRAEELVIANKELAFQSEEKEKRAEELIIANKELAFQFKEKEKRAEELIIAYKELAFQNKEKEKRAEELIIANEKAEESNRLKTAFLANLSHEIRTPMNGILGFAQLLENPDLAIDDQQRFIKIIKKSGERMLDTINGLLDITRIEAGEMKVSICETNINEQIKDIYNFFKPEVEKKGFQLSYITSLKDKDSFVKTDREKIDALLTNLVKNAIKFTEKGSIEFGYDIKGNSLTFFVKDTGVGISQEMKTMIFERFRQVDESHSRVYEGLGLGLSIAKSYVEMLGGKIWVESQKGEGSVFYFTIPYVAYKKEEVIFKETMFTDSPDHHIKKLKILIADDDEISGFLITLMLEIFGHEMFHAKDGVKAVELCKTNPDIDLVLMDIKMPKMNGLDATREIRQFNNDVIIIAQTAYALINDREKVLEAGCNDYITKPLKQDFLNSLIKKYFINQVNNKG